MASVTSSVVKEFEALLQCGIPVYGCLRLAYKSCLKEQIVAFSCRKRVFCPSCCAKRQVEAATHLVDNVLAMAPYRQFVVTFSIPMRYCLHSNKVLFAKVYRIITLARDSLRKLLEYASRGPLKTS